MSFLFRLAGELHKTVGELIAGRPVPITLAEFRLWKQYRKQYGFNTDRLEAGTAIAANVTAAAHGSKRGLNDFIPDFEGHTETLITNPRDQKGILAAVPSSSSLTFNLSGETKSG